MEPLRKGVIKKMAYLVEFWLILKSELVERSPHRIYFMDLKTIHIILQTVL